MIKNSKHYQIQKEVRPLNRQNNVTINIVKWTKITTTQRLEPAYSRSFESCIKDQLITEFVLVTFLHVDLIFSSITTVCVIMMMMKMKSTVK